jgi:hypothetical protein
VGSPGDDTALTTTVRSHQGPSICFSTAMGVGAYWTCLADVVHHAPASARLGLTDAVLADPPAGRVQTLRAAATVAALALVLAAFVGLHYLLAQGPSTLARYLDDIGAGVSRESPTCDRCERPERAAIGGHRATSPAARSEPYLPAR